MKIRKSILKDIFVLFAILLNSGHAFQTIFPNVSYLIPIGCFVLILDTVRDISRNKLSNRYIPIIYTVIFTLLTMIIHLSSGTYHYTQFLLMITFAFMVTTSYPDYTKLISVFCKMMVAVSFVAIIAYAVLNYGGGLGFLPVYKSYTNFEYGVAGIFNYIVMYPERNCGMFWEPGLFATYLSLAMIFEFLYIEKPRIPVVIIYVLGFITANSSAGFVLMALLFILFIVRNRASESTGLFKQIISFALFFAAIIVVLNIDTILSIGPLSGNDYVEKLMVDNLTTSTRFLAFGHNFSQFLSEPIFGVGFVKALREIRYVADNNTSLYILSVFGLPGIMYTIAWFIGIFALKQFNLYTRITLLVISFVIVNKEPHIQILLTWVVLFYLLSKKNSNILDMCDSYV